ncbi:multiheme c-type cytochrome [Ferrimonas balearica]|nr:cytochrome C [Ferrimonas balearica]
MMKYAVNRWSATLATAMLLGLTGCQDGKDGAPGEDGGVVSPVAEALTVAITGTQVVEGRLAIEFDARNELDLPVIKIDGLKVQAVQLQPYAEGERSQWQVLGYDKCLPGNCAGSLEELGDGQYRYTFAGALDGLYNSEFPQRVLLTVPATSRYPEATARLDAMADGAEPTQTRDIIDDARCLNCHESIDAIVHGGDETASCASCHTGNKMSDADKVWPVLAHQVHIGLSSRPVGNCSSCHETEARTDLAQALNWQTVPTRETCESCHDLASNPIYDHAGQPTNENCVECHSAESINDAHLGGYQKAQAEDQRGIVTVDVESAKLVDGAEVGEAAGEHYAMISLSLRDRAGERLILDAANPGNASWIKNLQMYVNWGASVDFTNSRGYSIFVKSNKKHGESIDGGYTPDGERPRTKPYLGGEQQAGVYVYKLGPIVTEDAISGDLLNDSGFITNRLIYCFDPEQNLVDCDTAGHAKNAAYNARWYFTKDGLTDADAHARPVIVSNAKCGSCHGYDEASDNTELSCRNCHSRKTEMNKALADTTCFSGHDDDELGEHLLPRMERAMAVRSQSGFVSSTADAVDPCLACHNPNTPPTQAIRELHTQAGDKYFVEELTVTHPDHKVWMHSLHANQRATQAMENGVRNVEYPADLANCSRCHEGDSFGVDRLSQVGRPLALDLDYNPDSQAHPATDISVDAYVSPVSATCYACHAKKPNAQGQLEIVPAVRAHMEQHGGRFGVPLAQLEVESCAVCHSVDNLKQAHKL